MPECAAPECAVKEDRRRFVLDSLSHQGFQRARAAVSSDARSDICRALFCYWDRVRADAVFPTLDDINLDELCAIASSLTIKDINLAPSGEILYTNRFWGADLREKLGFDGKDHEWADYSGSRGGQAMSTIYGLVVEHAAPVLSTGFLEFLDGCEDMGYEAIFLPLAAAGSPLPAHIIAAYDLCFKPGKPATT